MIIALTIAVIVPLLESVLFAIRFGRGRRHVVRGVVLIWIMNLGTFAIGAAAYLWAKPILLDSGYEDLDWAALGAWTLLSLGLTHVLAPKI